MSNTYKKYAAKVFIAVCEEQHEKGETIILTTKRGKENECIVHNFVGYTGTKENPKYCYSITRADEFDYKAWALRKAEKYAGYSLNAKAKSDAYYDKSNEHKDFLSLGEPIKVGHHSEKRHRKIIDQAWNNTGKFVEFYKKSGEYAERAEYWENRADEINLSMPDSLEYYEIKLHQAKERHQFLKDNPKERSHGYSLTYAKKEVNNMTKKYELAKKLWG